MPSAYLLVSHGSHDPRPDLAIHQLAQLLSEKLPKSENLVSVATLEVSPQPLHIQIQEFADQALAVGCDRLQIIPLFLLSGVHVVKDIPREVELAQQALSQKINIDLKPHLGSYANLSPLLIQNIATINTEAKILLAHGSRRLEAQQQVAEIAANIGAVAAFWSVPPSLEIRVKELVTLGYRQIAILSYFLFPGGITDAIAQAVEELKLQFPVVNFDLTPPLGLNVELADFIQDLIKQSAVSRQSVKLG